MKNTHLKSLIVVGFLIIVTGAAMGGLNRDQTEVPVVQPPSPTVFSNGDGPVTLSGQLIQQKVFAGSDGTVSFSLTMQAADVAASGQGDEQSVDMVIVLDQSGSMEGQKIEYARQSILNLLSGLSESDRFAIIGYANGVRRYSELTPVTAANREHLQSILYRISAGGGTNLGAGLQEGIRTLRATPGNGNVGKLILISDGLANEGITDISSLGNMASIAVEHAFAISTVGVGSDFNEELMAALADRGTGNYYYLSNPQAFAEIFHKEFQNSKTVAAQSLEIRVPLSNGMSLVTASGYPISNNGNQAIFHPGELLSGQSKTLFLTLQIPARAGETYELGKISARYLHKGELHTTTLSESFSIACVENQQEVVASVDTHEWEKKVLREDFNALQVHVAKDVKNGNRESALRQIEDYYTQQQLLNSAINSEKVKIHLEDDLDELRSVVGKTFEGSKEEIKEQQKQNAKSLQFTGYSKRRSNK